MRDEIFLTERTELESGAILFDRYDRITGRHRYTLWDPAKGEGTDVGEVLAKALKLQAVEQ